MEENDQNAATKEKEKDIRQTIKSYCEPCKEANKETNATLYCKECDELLCDECTTNHKTSKATKQHQPTSITEKQELCAKLCEPCQEKTLSVSAVNFCESCDEYLCNDCTNNHKLVKATKSHIPISVESKHNRQFRSTEVGNGTEKDGSQKLTELQTETTNQERPGKPFTSPTEIKADSIRISWDPPAKFEEEDYYQVSYKDVDAKGKWKVWTEECSRATTEINKLKSNTKYVFRVRVVYDRGEGPYSEESDEYCTIDSPASRIVKFATKLADSDTKPIKYSLPITEIQNGRNEKAKTKKFEIGSLPGVVDKEKTIMLVGATGTGKSTLVDGLVNYVLGVNWNDSFRFTVIDLEQEEKDRIKNQALSQTEWITCYTINPEHGSRLNYRLNLIDTPGFGDTRGLKRDQEIVEQIRQLFSDGGPTGISCIDSVCFIVKAPDARLTAVQKYIFQSIMSLFGKDIERNICSLITFADGIDPPVLAALRESQLPFGKHFTFNNSGLFAKNYESTCSTLSPMFWDMGLKSFQEFFNHLDSIPTRSLQLTKDVLDERFRLEGTIRNLQPKVDIGLSKVDQLKREIKLLDDNKSLIKENKDFRYEVFRTVQRRKNLPIGSFVTNCIKCTFTCHENCDIANDSQKAQCCAMNSCGYCNVCPDKCHWTSHANTPFIFEYLEVKEIKTYAEMQKKYQEATGKLLSQEQILDNMGVEIDQICQDIAEMMEVVKNCNDRLKEIALRPNPLTMSEHIDMMIEAEKLEKKPGFMNRINVLNEFQKRARVMTDAETFSKDARSALGFVAQTGKIKGTRDLKVLVNRVKSWFT